MRKEDKKPWATKDVMHQIYEKHLWGGKEQDFYSGDGSHNLTIVEPYVDMVASFLKSANTPLVVCDLGCGDFNVGKQLTAFTKAYIGIDIVENLIERNSAKFTQENVSFLCLDICKDELPKADCVLIRQVLQHLSNKEILQIVSKLKTYKYVIITEHLPSGNFQPNLDMVTSMGNRLKYKSGVNIAAAPFNFNPVFEEVLLNISIDNKSCIRTTMYQNF